MYKYLLSWMVRKPPHQPMETDKASKQKWDKALAKVKAARRAISEVDTSAAADSLQANGLT